MLAVERTTLEAPGLWVAEPRSDLGADLLVYRERPLRAVAVQVKGQESGLTVWSKHADAALITAYVLRPSACDCSTYLIRGDEAWRLPELYKQRGGRASDYHGGLATYRWSNLTALLQDVLAPFAATPARWEMLFEEAQRGGPV